MRNRTVTSECVSAGHPDKIADRISDAILDAYLSEDMNVRAGIETMVKDNIVVLGGEVRSHATINHEKVVRGVFNRMKFPVDHHLRGGDIRVINLIGGQSNEIYSGLIKDNDIIGAGDQGFMVGYASDETSTYMPLGMELARRIIDLMPRYFGPDMKSQVIVEYDAEGHASIKNILVSAMHQCDLQKMRDEVMDKVFGKHSLLSEMKDFAPYLKKRNFDIVVNPCGEWKTGGPIADCGVTGRKLVVDQYGGYCNIGGGAFSGKDFSKVDRSGAYMARYLAKNIVAAGLCHSAKVELAYTIGIPEPTAMNIQMDRNQEMIPDLIEFIKKKVDMTPRGMYVRFGGHVSRNEYLAEHGHFGVDVENKPWVRYIYAWEITDLIDIIRTNFDWRKHGDTI